MRILSITGGAANMYCGSCLRDNALAAELIRQGHDVILLPLYTPTRTDEANVSQERVFFGGISIYLQQRSALFRRMPRWLDRLWDAPSVIRKFSGRGIQVDPASLAALTISMLEGLNGHQRKEIDKLTDWVKLEPAPEIVTLPFSLLIALAKPLREATGAPVVCTLQGDELFLDGLPEPHRTRALHLIRAQVKEVDGFIAVSHYCARFMADYLRIPSSKIFTVPLGINLGGYVRRTMPPPGDGRIGYMARIAPEKGLHLLVDAYRILKSQGSRATLEVAGYLPPENRKYLETCQSKVPFVYRGEPSRDEKLAFLRSLDVLSVPCTYDEPKGLSVLEAMASGVPVVQTRRGAFPEMIEATGGGLLVEPDSPDALADGLRRLLEDRDLAHRLGAAGQSAVQRDFSIATMASRVADVYRAVVSLSGAAIARTSSVNATTAHTAAPRK